MKQANGVVIRKLPRGSKHCHKLTVTFNVSNKKCAGSAKHSSLHNLDLGVGVEQIQYTSEFKGKSGHLHADSPKNTFADTLGNLSELSATPHLPALTHYVNFNGLLYSRMSQHCLELEAIWLQVPSPPTPPRREVFHGIFPILRATPGAFGRTQLFLKDKTCDFEELCMVTENDLSCNSSCKPLNKLRKLDDGPIIQHKRTLGRELPLASCAQDKDGAKESAEINKHISSQCVYKTSKVIDNLHKEKGRLPFLEDNRLQKSRQRKICWHELWSLHNIDGTPGAMKRVYRNMICRYNVCNNVDGQHSNGTFPDMGSYSTDPLYKSSKFRCAYRLSALLQPNMAAAPPVRPLRWPVPRRNTGILPLYEPPPCSLNFCIGQETQQRCVLTTHGPKNVQIKLVSKAGPTTSLLELHANTGALVYISGARRESHMPAKFIWGPLSSVLYSHVTPLQRFKFITNCLRFDDKLTRDQSETGNSFTNMRYISDDFFLHCRNNYTPSPECTIDMQLLDCCGKCKF
ncbi:hypothetical protein PR048_017224 [Dryococelus australis]|uniref:PiggyBac transposable element-derived protein domain-containing protein n=1 Tax=Dryococelus australis TaxID=614101 RepID=A0ABQ9H905_9NEOP|nr:hypothetical protein PR048_017224 [Dryococelus australis]